MKRKNVILLILLNIFFSAVSLILNIAINMFLTPYITDNIGVEAYGFISLSNSFINYIDVISISLNSLATRYISIEYHNKNYIRANKYFNSVLIANVIFSIIFMIPAILVIRNLEKFIRIPVVLNKDVKILFFITLVNYLITIIGTVFNVAAFIKNRLVVTSFGKCISYVIKLIILLSLFLFFTAHVWFVSISVICATIFILIINIICTRNYTPELKVNLNMFSLDNIKEIISNGIWASLSSMGSILNSGLDLLVSNIILSAVAMGQLSISKNLITLFNTFISLFTQAFRPVQLEAYSKGDKNALVKEFNISMKVTGYICSMLFAGFIVLGHDFLKLWISNQNIDLIYNISILILVGDVLGAITYPLNYTFVLCNKLKFSGIINIIVGFLNIIFMFILLKVTNFELYAIVLTTTILNIIVQWVITPIIACKYLDISQYTFYPAALISLLNCCVLIILFKITFNFSGYILNWGQFIICVLELSFIGTLISLFILFNKNERIKIMTIFNMKK